MNPVPHHCPICRQADVIVSRLDCPGCQSQITGMFALHRLNKLTADQLKFVEIFLLNEGKINRVEQEMGISYAAVRARLHEIIAALGGSTTKTDGDDVEDPRTTAKERSAGSIDRQALLAKVSAGQLTASDAAAILSGKRPQEIE